MSRRRFSIKNLMVLIFGGLALTVWLPTYKYVTYTYITQLVAEKGGSVHDFAAALAAVIADNLKERQREIVLLAQSPFFQSASLEAPQLKEHLDRVKKSYPHYTWIGVADIEGVVRTSTGDLLRGASVKGHPWFMFGLAGSYLGDLHQALLSSKQLPPSTEGEALHLIDFAAPLVSPEGQLRGVLGTHADWRWIADVIKVVKPTEVPQSSLDILIINSENRVIFPKRLDGKLKVPSDVRVDQPFGVTTWDDGVEYVSSMVNIDEQHETKSMGWRIIVRQPTAQTLRDVDALQNVIQATIIFSIIVFLSLLWWGATRISTPLRQLSAQARRIERGAETKPMKINTMALEVSELATALFSMAATLLDRKNALAQNNARLEETVAIRTAELERANRELQRLARNDALTGLPNRLAADERLETEFVRMKRSQKTYCVLMADIDFFKSINDTHGHAVGDQVLRRIAQTIKTTLRESDFAARFGGEEFLIILPDTHQEVGRLVAEKLRRAVESSADPIAGNVTVSIGLAMSSPMHANGYGVFQDADSFLYQAKKTGRNRIDFRL